MRIVLATLIAILLSSSVSAAEYDVLIDGTAYTVRDGVPATITAPRGETFSLTVKMKAQAVYTDEYITFTYPSDMKVSNSEEMGVRTVTAETEGSTLFMVQVYPYLIDPSQAVNSMIGNFEDEYKNMGAVLPQDNVGPSTREIGGVALEGKQLVILLGNLRSKTEIYAAHKGEVSLVLIFQATHDDRPVAEKYFAVIAESLE